MEPVYTAVPSYVGGFIGATASADFPSAVAAGEAASQQGLHTAAVGLQQQPPAAAVPRTGAPFQSYYAPAETAGVVASVCALPAATPSAFMPLQQQHVRSGSTSSTSNSHNTTSYRSRAVLGSTAPVGISYRRGLIPTTCPIPGSAAAFYPASAASVGSAAASPPAALAAPCGLPAVGFGLPPTGSAEARGLTLAETGAAGSSGAASAAVAASVSVAVPVGRAVAPIGAASAGGLVENLAATTSAAAGLPVRVALESLSAEDRGLLQQTRRLLEEGISNTFECITLLSGVLLSHGTSPLIHHLLQAWEEAGQQQQSDEKMLCLLYVMNDALQKCRRRGCPLLLLLALQPLHRFCCKIAKQHESVLRSCMRVIRILKDAKAFGPPTKRCSSQIADALLAALQGNGAAVALPPAAVIQQVLETCAEESSSEANLSAQQQGLRQSGLQQEENVAAAVEVKGEKNLQQQLLHVPSGGGGGGNGGGGVAAEAYHQMHHKIGGGYGAAMLGGSVFLQHANSNSSMRTLPAAIDTFLLQYPVPGDEALAAHIDEKYPGDPQEAALRQQISDVFNAIAAAQSALADKAVARRRVEERLRELQHEKQRLRERAERVQRAAAGGAQAQLLLWQQMQQQLQQGGERVDFSLEGIATEQERLGNLVRAAHAKLRVLLKTEWNRRVELQGVLLSLGQAIEERLDVILPQHVHCREVKSVIDRAALLQSTRQQRKQRQQRQEQAEEEQRQQQQQGQRQEAQQQQHQKNQAQEEQRQRQRQQQQHHQESPLSDWKGDYQQQQEQREQKEEQQHRKKQQQRQQAQGRQQHASDAPVTNEREEKQEAEEQLPPQSDQQLQGANKSESQARMEQEQGTQLLQQEDGQQEEEPTFTEDDGGGGEGGIRTGQTLLHGGDHGDVEEQMQVLQESSRTNVDDYAPPDTEELYSEEQLPQEHVDNDDDEQRQLEQHEVQPFEHLEEHDGWLV